MQTALGEQAYVRRFGDRRTGKIGDAEDRYADFLAVLQRGLNFSRHLQKVNGDQHVRRLQETGAAPPAKSPRSEKSNERPFSRAPAENARDRQATWTRSSRSET